MIEISSDKVKISGPRIDGSYTITFEVGEYERENIAKLLILPQGQILAVTVDIKEKKK